jgi:Zn-finger nucleic acid-binding protein
MLPTVVADSFYNAAMNACPRCGGLLNAQGTRFVCAGCKGSWIGDDEFRQLIYGLAPDLDLSLPIRFATRATTAPLVCPLCREPMRPIRFARTPLDRCDRDHALWLDDDELRRVLEHVGLDYADREKIRAADPMNYETGMPVSWVPPLEPDPPSTGFVAWVRRLFGQTHRPEP